MVDKLFIMLKEHKVITEYDMKSAWDDFYTDETNKDIKDDIDSNYARNLNNFINEQTTNWSAEDLDKMSDEEYEQFDEEFKAWMKSNGIKMYNLSTNNQARKAFGKWFAEQIKQKGENGKPKYFKSRRIEVIKYSPNKMPQEMSRKARNNMIVDLTRAIMANPKSSYKINNPGNYDNLGREADRDVILRSPEYVEQWCKSIIGKPKDSLTTSEIVQSILKADSKKIDGFLKKYKKAVNPLSLETFMYYHNQNMTGGKLIGIYANNTTIQAKYQQSELGMSQQFGFYINGFKTGDLSGKYRDIKVKGKTVRVLISKNCAEFSAASVDNVKDPKLANLLQSPDNAYITGTMLRMGLSIEEIGLFFSMPFFDTQISKVIGKNEQVKAMYQSTEPLEITSEELASIIIDPNAPRDKAKAIFAKILTVAEEVKSLTQISRADSPNGAISNTLEGAILQVMKVTNFHKREERLKVLTGLDGVIINNIASKNSTRDQLREAIFNSDMPLLQGFYYTGIEGALNISSLVFKQVNSTMFSALERLNRNYKYPDLNEKIIGRYLKEAVVYGLSKSEMFSEDINSQRAYYLNNFYEDFLEAKKDPEVSKYSLIRALGTDSYGNINLENAPRLKGVKDIFARDLDLMLFSDNPKVRDLAINLFKYSYFKDGLGWRPNGFSNMFNTLFLSSLPSYIDSLRSMNFDSSDNYDWDNYYEQFIRNHATDLFSDLTPPWGIDVENVEDSISFDAGKVSNINDDNNPYNYIIYGSYLFEVDLANSTNDSVVYNKTYYISDFNTVYDANSSYDELVDNYNKSTASAKTQKNNKPREFAPVTADMARPVTRKPRDSSRTTSLIESLGGKAIDKKDVIDKLDNNAKTMEELLGEYESGPQEMAPAPKLDEYDGNKENGITPC